MIYLDNAATSWPKPAAVAKTMTDALARCGNPGRSGHRLALEGGKVLLSARQSLAQLLDVPDPFSVIFTLNCTDALNLAIKGLLPRGGHVVTTCVEHNSVLRPLGTLRQRGLVRFDAAPMDALGRVDEKAFARLLRADTRLAVISHVSNVTGVIQPVEALIALCHQRGIPVLVDGAQAVGHMPVSLSALGADAYAFSGHKGIPGPGGCGVLVLGPHCRPQTLREGGTGSSSLQLTQPEELPDLYEAGTPATCAIAGLWAASEFVLRFRSVLYEQEQRLRDRLLRELADIPRVHLLTDPGAPGVGCLAFTVEGYDSAAFADALEARFDIACRPGLHCAPLLHRAYGTQDTGAVRFSLGAFTSARELSRAVTAVRILARQGHPD